MKERIFSVAPRSRDELLIYLPLVTLLLTVLVPRNQYFVTTLYAALLFYTLYYFSRYNISLSELGISKKTAGNFRRDLLPALVASVGLFVINYMILPRKQEASLLSTLSKQGAGTLAVAIPTLVVMVLAKNFIEELFWRGFLQKELTSVFSINPNYSIFITSTFFAFWSANAWHSNSSLTNFLLMWITGAVAGYLLNEGERLMIPVYARTILDSVLALLI